MGITNQSKIYNINEGEIKIERLKEEIIKLRFENSKLRKKLIQYKDLEKEFFNAQEHILLLNKEKFELMEKQNEEIKKYKKEMEKLLNEKDFHQLNYNKRLTIFEQKMGKVCLTFVPYEGTWCDGQLSGNMCNREYGDDCIVVTNGWDDVFVKNSGVNITSDYHFKDAYKEYENKVGIYAGTGFSDGALPPIPYISEKKIAEQTDAAGKLSIQIKVKAGDNDGSSQSGTTGGSESDVTVGTGGRDGM